MGNIYIDTHLLINLVEDKAQERTISRNILNSIKSSQKRILIPQIVIGETISILFKKNQYDYNQIRIKTQKTIGNMYNTTNMSNYAPALKFDTCEHVSEIRRYIDENDNGKPRNLLEYHTDMFIVAQAISDPDSEFLITSDRNLLLCKGIPIYVEKLFNEGKRNESFSITEEI